MKTQVLTEYGLALYDQEFKQYIKNLDIGMTESEVKNMIQVQISTDDTYEPLETGGSNGVI